LEGIKSVTAGGKDTAGDIAQAWWPIFASKFPTKAYWFLSNDYRPHEWQIPFHAATTDENLLCPRRHLVAGRRGGKTLSAAWDTLFYCLYPNEFHRDVHGVDSQRPLWVWILAKNHDVGFPARLAFLDAMRLSGLVKGKDYEYNKTEKRIEFDNGTIVQFKTADDPQSLRGAGLDILWIDEAAFIPNEEAWSVVRPALSDKEGILTTTTTPKGKNWFYEQFWSAASLKDNITFRVEYTSLDNPFLSRREWDTARRELHPVVFKQEYMAAFDAMSGIELHGDWLHYYTYGKVDPQSGDVELPKDADGRIRLRKYIGVDPAISMSDRADHFAMALIGISMAGDQAFLLKTYKGHLPFPDQIDKIKEWWLEHRPEYIGIESNAFQRSLEQQAARMGDLPPVVPVISRGKKSERILAMAPVFKIGKVRLHRSAASAEFVDEWVSYDSTIKNPKDDLLDAVEIALSAAGVLLPTTDWNLSHEHHGSLSIEEEAFAAIKQAKRGKEVNYDPELGVNA
jgi:predicted phage terminase large subunit-like protein